VRLDKSVPQLVANDERGRGLFTSEKTKYSKFNPLNKGAYFHWYETHNNSPPQRHPLSTQAYGH